MARRRKQDADTLDVPDKAADNDWARGFSQVTDPWVDRRVPFCEVCARRFPEFGMAFIHREEWCWGCSRTVTAGVYIPIEMFGPYPRPAGGH